MSDNRYKFHYPSDTVISLEMERRNRLIGTMRELLGIPWCADLETLEVVFRARVKELLGPSNELKELRSKINFIKIFVSQPTGTRTLPAPPGVPVVPKPEFLTASASPEPTDTSR